MLLGRRWYRLPIDFTALKTMPALAVLFVFGARMTVHFDPGGYAPVLLNGLLFAALGGFAIRRFGLLAATPAGAVSGQRLSVR